MQYATVACYFIRELQFQYTCKDWYSRAIGLSLTLLGFMDMFY
jgi:hypothetical protein